MPMVGRSRWSLRVQLDGVGIFTLCAPGVARDRAAKLA